MRFLRWEDSLLLGKKVGIYCTSPEDWESVGEMVIKVEMESFDEDIAQPGSVWSTFNFEKAICLVAKVNDEIVGYTMGTPIEYTWIAALDHQYNLKNKRTIYMGSTAILPEYQRKGIGNLLKESFLKIAKQENYERLTAHCISEGSLKLNLKFGGKILYYDENWLGRGAHYVEIDLDGENVKNLSAPAGI